ncbi:MAG: YlmC/YmxH family sporulation protein [bacterium]|jgi:YlmC/YmxH family sporulation protein|nr:YlmC/YmxH family sporulation protein [Bacillota bacterium]
MVRISDLKMREVINVLDGKRMGVINDIDVDIEEGRIKALIVPGTPRLLGLFGKNDDLVIPWERIKKIGVDVILVEVFTTTEPKHK